MSAKPQDNTLSVAELKVIRELRQCTIAMVVMCVIGVWLGLKAVGRFGDAQDLAIKAQCQNIELAAALATLPDIPEATRAEFVRLSGGRDVSQVRALEVCK